MFRGGVCVVVHTKTELGAYPNQFGLSLPVWHGGQGYEQSNE
jgi:hypothetical protein